jgi:Zn finger protein HypA/HybF involved in hydrogenase expression
MYTYYENRYKWSQNTIQKVWWDAQRLALDCFGSDAKTSIQKFIHNRMACNEQEHKYYKYKSAVCHECKTEIEDECHILKCGKCTKQQNLSSRYQ